MKVMLILSLKKKGAKTAKKRRKRGQNNVKENNVYSIKQAFVLSNFNISNDGIITYYPIYMTMVIDERSIDLPKIEKIDFSILNN